MANYAYNISKGRIVEKIAPAVVVEETGTVFALSVVQGGGGGPPPGYGPQRSNKRVNLSLGGIGI